MTTTVKLAGAALNQTPMDWENNMANIIEAINQARQNQVKILGLPELCICGYGCEDLYLSDWLPQKAMNLLPEIARHCEDITVSVGLPVIHQSLRYSAACLIHNQKILGISAKQYLANEGVHYEPRWFTPWPAGKADVVEIDGVAYHFGDIVYEVDGLKIAYEICEDAWVGAKRPGYQPDKAAVDLILNPSASHFAFNKNQKREQLVLEGARDFGCAYVYTNLLGNEAGRMVYDGEIFIAQHGKMVQRNERLSFKQVNMVTSTIDFKNPENSYGELKPILKDKNLEFAKATSLALFDYLRKSRSQGFVLSLSGGADSSACAVMVAEMARRGIEELGIEAFFEKIGKASLIEKAQTLSQLEAAKLAMNHLLICAYQGTKNSSEDTLNSARSLAESIGAQFYHWEIDQEVASYTQKAEHVIGRPLSWETDDITLQNIQARARSPIIWMLANINNALLLTTSNRSEGDVGYTTMDGDTSGSIAPIAAVDKHFVIQWLKWAEKALGYPGLQYVNSLSPSAELRPLENVQTDEDDLMPYEIMAEIERYAIKMRKSPVEVYEALLPQNLVPSNVLKAYIIKFHRLWTRNQWKRERIAPAFHLDDFNVDPRTWCRFPILSSGFDQEIRALEAY